MLYNCKKTNNRLLYRLLVSALLLALTAGSNVLATDAGIASEIRTFGSLLDGKDRIYFEGKVMLNQLKPSPKKEQHSFNTWYFSDRNRYKTYYEDGTLEINSVWDGKACHTWRSENKSPAKGTKTKKPEWQIGADHLNTPSDYVLDGLNGYKGLLANFDFSNRQEKGPIRIFDVRPNAKNPMAAGYPDNAIMRILFDSNNGMIIATYQELPGKMTASVKIVNHWFEGDPAVVLRTPINVNFE